MTVPGGYIAGDVLTAANMNLLPAGEVAYAQVTSNQTGITTGSDLTSLTVTFTAVAGRRYKLTGQCLVARTATAPNPATLHAKESTTVLAVASVDIARLSSGTPSATNTLRVEYVNNASISGSKTWKLLLGSMNYSGSDSAGTVDMLAASTYPAFILVEDIGPL